MRIFLLFFLLTIIQYSFSQSDFIEWGYENKNRTILQNFFPEKGLDGYGLRLQRNLIVDNPTLVRYENGKELFSKKIARSIEKNIVNFEEVIFFNSTLFVFFTDKSNGMNRLIMQGFDKELDKFNPPLELTNYPVEKVFEKKGFFNITLSQDESKMCVEYLLPAKRSGFETIGYKTFDSSFNLLSEGEFSIPLKAQNSSVDVRHLTNSGQFFIGVSLFNNNDFSIWRDHKGIEKTIIYQPQTDSLFSYDLFLDNQRVFDFKLSSLNNMLIVTGTYGDNFGRGAKGVFYQNIRIDSHTIQKESLQDFPAEVLQEEKNASIFRQFNRNGILTNVQPDLMNYAFRNIHVQEDGSVIVLAEQFYIQQLNSTDARGYAQTINYFYYDDLICYKIDSLGKFEWFTKIEKEQISSNDYGYFSSIISYVSEGKMNLFFNDNIQNYESSGSFNDNAYSIEFPVRKKLYCLAEVQIDLKNGNHSRNISQRFEDVGAYVIPKKSTVNKVQKELVFFAANKIQRLGFLSFK